MKRIIVLLTILLSTVCQLSAQTEFELRGQATKLSKSCFTVNLNQGNQKGAIWWPDKVDLTKDLDLHFVVYLGDKDAGGADGLAFVMHRDTRGMGAEGEVGGGLYFGEHPSQGANVRITPSVAIEFDTYQNAGSNDCAAKVSGGKNDPTFDHTTVVYNGNICYPEFDAVQLHPDKGDVENNSCYSSEIRWRPGRNGEKDELSLFFEGKLRFTHKDYILKDVLKGDINDPSNPNNFVNYGFTGSTGGLSNEQTICIFEGNSKPMAKDDYVSTAFGNSFEVDVQANDKDSDGDALYTTQILVHPKNGTASIAAKNKITYSPKPLYVGEDSLQYRVCDIDPGTGGEKCYANCSNAWVYIDKVQCPTYSLEVKKINENEKCEDALANNGSAQAYMWDGVTKFTKDITFKWYFGYYNTLAEVNGITPFEVANVADSMAEGTYTVFAQYKTCTFSPVRITIARKKDPPVFSVFVKKPLTTCEPSNGEAQVKLTDEFAVYTDYSFTWYKTYPGSAVGQNYILSGVSAGTYIVRVTHNRSGCVSQGSITIPNNYVSPSISYTSVPRTNCDDLNGKLSANVGGNTIDYTFYWAKYNDKKFLKSHSGSVYDKLDIGDYWLTGIDKLSGCPLKDTLLVKVEDGRKSPVIKFTTAPQTSCNPSAPNANIEVETIDGGKPLGNYSFNWYNGNGELEKIASTSVAEHKAFKLPAGEYTLVVIDKKTGCKTSSFIVVEEELESFELNSVVVGQTKCSPADGSISLMADPDGAAGPKAPTTNNYTFEWWKGKTVTIATPDYTTASITGLTAGDYTVRVTSKEHCKVIKTFTIAPPSYPTVSVALVKPQTSCDLSYPTGRLTATVSPTAGYTYKVQWYYGDGTSSPMSGYKSLVADTLGEGVYTVKVINEQTGCTATAKGTVTSSPSPKPNLTVSGVVNQTLCSDPANGGKPNGSVTATSTTSGVEFHWFNGEFNSTQLASKTADFVGSKYENLAAGKYTVIAIDKVNHCISEPTIATVADNTGTINISISVINSTGTNCIDGSGSKLTAEATIGGSSGSFLYKWYKGSPETTSPPFFASSTPMITPAGPDGKEIMEISPSRYTVVVQNLNTGCWAYASKDLGSLTPIPTVKLITTDNSVCPSSTTIGNGKISIDLVYRDKANNPGVVMDDPFVLSNYYVYFFKGTTRPSDLTPLNQITYPGLAPGFYTVFVKEKTGNGCESYYEKVEVKNAEKMEPVIEFAQLSPQTSCASADGKLTLKITNAQGGDFTKYKYYLNGGVGVTFTAASIDIPNMTAGTHNVRVVNTNSGCSVSASATIDKPSPVAIPDIEITAINTKCGKGNGEMRIVSPNTVRYEYYWFHASTKQQLGKEDGTTVILPGLDSGDYYIEIFDKTTSCSANRIEKRILDERIIPAVSVKSVTNQTVCDGPKDGTVTITLASGTVFNDPAAYGVFAWTRNGVPMSTAPVIAGSGNEFTASGLASGTYTLEVKSAVSECATTISFEVYDVYDLPKVTALGIAKTVCNPSDAEASVISTVPASLDVNGFVWYQVVNGTKTFFKGGTNKITELIPGDYAVTVTNAKGCVSYPYQVTIKDNTPKIQISLLDLEHQTNCDSLVRPNGKLRVEVVPGGGNYSIKWTSLRGLTFTQENNFTISDLRGGTYRVTVTDFTTGCDYQEEFTIENRNNTKTPLVSVKNNTNCENYNGILSASVDGISTGYTFNWYKGASVKANPDFTTAEIRGLVQGDYTLVLIDNSTTCPRGPLTYKVGYTPIPIKINILEESPITNCDYIERPDGQYSASVDGKLVGYKFDWYSGSLVNSTSNTFSTGSTASNLSYQAYTLRVIDLITGCIRDTTFTPRLNLPVVPAPDVDSIRHLTNCVSPNGYALVSVAGNTSHYTFNWYLGSEVDSSPDYTGYELSELNKGDYLVTATDIVSNCTSEPVNVTILDKRIFVDFNVKTKNSLCNENNGEASITWIEPVGVTKIQMTNGISEYSSDINYNLPYGEFEVTVETVEGCITTKTVKIGADYNVFNGISPNGDGQNDIFAIDCITLYPNNTVTIFNRAGALVYKGKGYDNESVYFAGYGNSGIYTTGNFLPDGTYYYIVDTGDGGKPKAGFLELLR